jgi:hypothetical protein
MSLNDASGGMEKGLTGASSAIQPRKKVWYYGRLIETFCPVCESPLPFAFGCARCGWRREDEEVELNDGHQG